MRTATNPQTGERVAFVNGKWIPASFLPPEAVPPKPSPMASMGRGMMDIWQGGKQLLGMLSPEEDAAERENRALYERGRGPDAGMDWMRLGGQVAGTAPLAFIPGSQAGLIGRTLSGAAAGAAAGGLVYADRPEDRRFNVLGGAIGGGAFGAAAPSLAKAVGRTGVAINAVGRRIWQKLNQPSKRVITGMFDDAAERSGVPAAQLGASVRRRFEADAAEALATGKELEPDSLLRKAAMEAYGFTDDAAPLRGQVTRTPGQFSTEMNLAKVDDVGAPLEARYAAQRARVGEYLDETRTKLGGPRATETSAFDAGEALEGAVKKRSGKLQKRVDKAYKKARGERPDVGIAPDMLEGRLASVMDEMENSIPGDVRSRISKLLKSESIDPLELEKLDALASRFYGLDKAVNYSISQIKQATRGLLDDVGAEYGGLWREAVKKAAKRFEAIGKRTGMTSKMLNDLAEPEKSVQFFMGGPVRQIRKLTNFIGKDSPEALTQARAAVMNEIIERANPSGNFSQAAYNNTIRRMGRERLTALFGKESAAELKGFGIVARDLFAMPAGHSVNVSNTATAGANMLKRVADSVINDIPGLRLFSGLREAAKEGARRRENVKLVMDALDPLPSMPPISSLPNPIEPALPYVRGMAPGAGLLGTQSQRR
jgi:hypothetical protein